MDIDTTKENIQPLRGGRNVQQLEMALQAQTNRELQLELQQKEQEYRNLIENYQGDDPLENYYNYILWIEQCYPKHGHEGNLAMLLEQCLGLFENDTRYTNDRRFCKLWIKYFDMQPNPIELYQMMKAKGICTGCADLYKAWAYYYEAGGDFQSANMIFEEGKRNLAQPYTDLDEAHKNLFLAAGQHVVYGPDENRLMEKRHALTSLRADRSGRVPSVRTPNVVGPTALMPSNSSAPRPNAVVPIYETREVTGAEAPPASLITVARRQEMPKENTMKPGPWATVPVKKRVVTGKSTLGFVVHEDECEGIRLPKNHPKESVEDYSNWIVQVKYPEPPNPAMVPMYPKHRVYMDPNTEYSLEELRAIRYIKQVVNSERTMCHVDDDAMSEGGEVMGDKEEFKLKNSFDMSSHSCNLQPATFSPQLFFPQASSKLEIQQGPSLMEGGSCSESAFNHDQRNNTNHHKEYDVWNATGTTTTADSYFKVFEQSFKEIQPEVLPKGSAMKTAFNDLNADDLVETGSRGGMDVAAVAQATDSAKPMPFSADSSPLNSDYQEEFDELDNSCNTNMFLNLNAMQVSTPCKNSNIENANGIGMDVSKKMLFAEPVTEKKGKELSTILEETKSYGSSSSSSNAMKSSSCNSNKMGTILEEHSNYLAQNMMANAALRTSLIGNLVDLPASPIAVTQASPIAVSQAAPSIKKQYFSGCEGEMLLSITPPISPLGVAPLPADVNPVDYYPSDPFKASVISQLLERISFPGPHGYGYFEVGSIPRLCMKKEPIALHKDKYLIEKQLGKGTFGTIYKALDMRRNRSVALKFQKPANRWEFYMCREIQSRLISHPLKDRFMNVMFGYFGDQGSILISEYMPAGSLLNLANLFKQKIGKMKESLIIHFCIQMLEIVETLHNIKIIHADIKPDNFLVFTQPDNLVCLQLIDFGCSIDMALFPPDAIFTRPIQTEDFICCEVLDGRPWNYHTDLFCIAATAHVLLFDKYIRMTKRRDGTWSITARFPRYMKADLWEPFFDQLLNQRNGPADTGILQVMLREHLDVLNRDSAMSLAPQLRQVTNLLKNR